MLILHLVLYLVIKLINNAIATVIVAKFTTKSQKILRFYLSLPHKIQYTPRALSNSAFNKFSGGYSSVGRAPDCDSGCRGFKSL